MGDDELVIPGHPAEQARCRSRSAGLALGLERLTPFQQGVAAERHHRASTMLAR